MVECERALALDVEVASVAEGIVGADYDLVLRSAQTLMQRACSGRSRTGWLLPGSVTVVNCSSLYLSSAGPSDWRELSPAIVLMAVEGFVRSLHAVLVRRGVPFVTFDS